MRSGAGSVNLYSARRVNGVVTSLTGVVPPVTIAGRDDPPERVVAGERAPSTRVLAPVGTSVVGALELLANWFDLSSCRARLAALHGSQMLWGDQIPAQQMIWGDQIAARANRSSGAI